VNTKTSIPDKVAVFNGDQYIATMAKISYNNLRTYREFVDMLNGGLNMYGMHKDNISVTEETYENGGKYMRQIDFHDIKTKFLQDEMVDLFPHL